MTDAAEGHWFEGIADHLGTSYLRYSFTMGTANEVDFLVDELGLQPGMRVLDVGCGPGRHAYALAERGIPDRVLGGGPPNHECLIGRIGQILGPLQWRILDGAEPVPERQRLVWTDHAIGLLEGRCRPNV